MRIGFLGPRGTFTEEAMDLWLEREGIDEKMCEKIALPSISDVMNSVGALTDMAIVPIENSIEGSVNITIDSLIHGLAGEVTIVGEVILPVSQNLYARGMLPLGEILAVYSHPQALYQCRDFLSKSLPQAQLMETSSTAKAAEMVSMEKGNIAAIGSRSLAGVYDIVSLAQDIQDRKNNMTRFYLISQEGCDITGRDKTTLVFSTKNRPGSLYECLKVFADRHLNLTKIESRPSRRILGEYVFFIEVEGYMGEGALKAALVELESTASSHKVLGSYPIFPS